MTAARALLIAGLFYFVANPAISATVDVKVQLGTNVKITHFKQSGKTAKIEFREGLKKISRDMNEADTKYFISQLKTLPLLNVRDGECDRSRMEIKTSGIEGVPKKLQACFGLKNFGTKEYDDFHLLLQAARK